MLLAQTTKIPILTFPIAKRADRGADTHGNVAKPDLEVVVSVVLVEKRRHGRKHHEPLSVKQRAEYESDADIFIHQDCQTGPGSGNVPRPLPVLRRLHCAVDVSWRVSLPSFHVMPYIDPAPVLPTPRSNASVTHDATVSLRDKQYIWNNVYPAEDGEKPEDAAPAQEL